MTTHAPIFARERNATVAMVRKYAGKARQIMLAKSAKRKRDGG